MPIYQRGEVWYVDVTTPSGKRVRGSARTTDRQEAQELHDRLKSDSWREDKLGERRAYRWEEAAVRWLKEQAHKASLSDDAAKIKRFSKYFQGKPLTAVTRTWVAELVEAFAEKSGTRNRYVALIRAILRKAEREWEWIERAPAFRTYRESQRRISWVTPEQAQALVDALPESYRDVARFALATGLRQGNVLGLRWEQVDLRRRVAWIFGDEAKGREPIPVALNSDAVAIVRRQIGADLERVFTLRSVRSAIWEKARTEAGLPGFRFHDLRHCWASWLLQSGVPLPALQEMGGWSDVRMVRRYAHLAPEHLSPYAERIAGRVPVNGTVASQAEGRAVG